ncbi:MAG: glycoside hydrolase, partial [Candidatus Aenigmatarchaeota archaeon]
GASWVVGHERWIWGEKRANIAREIEEISKIVNEINDAELLKLLLIAETSCYVYWGTDYWFEQGKKILSKIKEKIRNL